MFLGDHCGQNLGCFRGGKSRRENMGLRRGSSESSGNEGRVGERDLGGKVAESALGNGVEITGEAGLKTKMSFTF